ncbi:MAG: hypothetical protein M3N49_11440, partial [Candidatus Eremiobacteraeota bacterium]|nr:hypothetical protein [Candidatus Eremiobacteraeota bacterium]
PALSDRSGVNWPSTEGEEPAAAYWCHGAAGIGRFWLHAAELDVLPRAAELSRRAALTTARGSRWASPTQCHGIAGSIEFLLDAFQSTGCVAHLAEARSLARILDGLKLERGENVVWASESPVVVTPDFNVGYAGVAVTLLRLADPRRRPHCLSRRGFRYHRPR